jgi:hypothetical protein
MKSRTTPEGNWVSNNQAAVTFQQPGLSQTELVLSVWELREPVWESPE